MGYIKIHRKIFGWEWYGDPKVLALWIHILLSANFKENEWRGEAVERGSFVTSLSALSAKTGLSVQEIRTCLHKLEISKQITIATNKYTKITVCNYDSYQGLDDDEQQAENYQHADQQQINTICNKKSTSKNESVTNCDSDSSDMFENVEQQEINMISNKQSTRRATTTKECRRIIEEKKDTKVSQEKKDSVERIYALYPSTTIRGAGKCYIKSAKNNKAKIERLLNIYSEEQLSNLIRAELESKQGAYLKDFSTFLNNLPDIPENEPAQEVSLFDQFRNNNKPQDA